MFVYEFQIRSKITPHIIFCRYDIFATFVVPEFTPLFEFSSIALLLLIDAISRIEL